MPGPSPAKLGAVRTLVEMAPDQALRSLEAALRGAPGESMAPIREIVEGEQRDRRLRADVLAPVLPLFIPRPDGMAMVGFPARVLSALWSELKLRSPSLIEKAAELRAYWEPGEPTPPVYDEICEAAAVLLRVDHSAVFRAGDADTAMAEQLAGFLDLARLARSVLRRLPDWLGKANEERVASLKLAFKDATLIAEDATPRLLELILTHLPEPWVILRLIAVLTDRAGDRYLAVSELAGFGTRLLDEADRRIARVRSFDADGGAEGARRIAADVLGSCACLTEFEHAIDLSREGPWGLRVSAAKKSLAANVEGRLREVDSMVALALPLQTVRIAGRMTRPAPRLTADPDERLVNRARAVLVLLEECRPAAPVGGYGALRTQVSEKVAERLDVYADELLHLVNAGEAPDEDRAQAFLEVAAEFLTYARDAKAGQIVRRRAAVAGERQPSQDVA